MKKGETSSPGKLEICNQAKPESIGEWVIINERINIAEIEAIFAISNTCAKGNEPPVTVRGVFVKEAGSECNQPRSAVPIFNSD